MTPVTHSPIQNLPIGTLPIRAVIFDIHSTLVDQGSAPDWLDAALAHTPANLAAAQAAQLVDFLDRIWEGARIKDPRSRCNLSFADHERIFHELLKPGEHGAVVPSLRV